MTPEMEKILNRVRKMMALANDSAASEGERDNALRMAHATLAKYNLSMAQAEAASPKKPGSPEDAKRMKHGVKSKREAYVGWIAQAVATLFFCENFRITYPNHAIFVFVGREDNAITAGEMFTYLVESVLRQANAERGGRPADSFTRAFGKGAAMRIYERCEALRKEAETASAKVPGTALVLASYYQQEQAANRGWMVLHVGPLTKGRQVKVGGNGFAEGRAYGDRVSLNRQIK